MSKFLQTIGTFILIGAMLAFIFSALRPAQYAAESKFLVISNNIECNCDKNLANTLIEVINSEVFQKKIAQLNNGERLRKQQLEIKKTKNKNVIKVKIWGKSLSQVRQLSKNIETLILTQTSQYYPSPDRVTIKNLLSTQIIRTPRSIMKNVALGILFGTIIGLIAIFLVGIRLDILNSNQWLKERSGKKRHKTKKKDYTTIIKKRLEKELSKKTTQNLIPLNEEYVFAGKDKSDKVKQGDKVRFKKISKKSFVETKSCFGRKDISSNSLPKIRVISASTMMVGKHDKEIEADKVPDNLPIFIEDKLPPIESSNNRNVSIETSSVKQVVARNKPKSKEEKGIKTRKIYSTKENIDTSNQKTVNVYSLRPGITKKKTKVPGFKKASAHDIANGFAPAEKGEEGPSNEEIKDRLNRLLRGEL